MTLSPSIQGHGLAISKALLAVSSKLTLKFGICSMNVMPLHAPSSSRVGGPLIALFVW
jgi:hypothetical protein